ncbi:putative metalloreductase [Pichia kluyveri]|uniref:Probable metalloreductase AIM14 n=1 Tax=Pichia kluyveri TaxID=36015 RepID=A0AAV5R1T7_PICKL|nr:putative metalloreductase [Pichia kluyveri]
MTQIGSDSWELNYVVQSVKRHSTLHKVNIKYGYILFGLSCLFIIIRLSALQFYNKSWKRSGRSTSNLRISKLPLSITVSLVVLTIAILMVIKPHLEKISVLIKRMGRLSYTLTPLTIFLAAEPSWFPIDNYLNTLQLHKWISRIIVLLGVFHGIGFLIYYVVNNTLEKVLRPVNFIGVIIFILGIIMMIFWKPIRNLNYKVFYVFHNIFFLTYITLTYLHARPGVGLFHFISIGLLFAQYIRKYLYVKDITITEIIENPGSDYKIIKFPKSLLPESYLPGSHVRIGASKWSPFFIMLPSHPYTVATTFENRDLLATLIVKNTKFQLQPFETYSIQTNFKSSINENFFSTAENIVIVCGGSGISLGLVLFEFFKRSIIADGKDIKIKFIWITKDEKDLFILNDLNIQGVDVYITNGINENILEQDEIDMQESENSAVPLIELSNNSSDSLNTYETKFSNTAILSKRPNLEDILQKSLSKTLDYANKWIVSCGPPSLNKRCESIATKEKCRFFSEEYSF